VSRDKIQAGKQQVVRDAIHDAAIRLFAAKGFEETTVDEIAQAAGISRRSFFHYFVSKDDLLAQDMVKYGAALVEAVKTFPATSNTFELLNAAVAAGIKYTTEQPELRQMMEISQASTAARQAYASRSVDVEDCLAAAYAQHLKSVSKFSQEPRLLSHLTLSVMRVALTAWFTGEHQDLSIAAKQVLANLTRLTRENSGSSRSRNNFETPAKSVDLPARRRNGRSS
jgi:AcrR family transcriptional regulator